MKSGILYRIGEIVDRVNNIVSIYWEYLGNLYDLV